MKKPILSRECSQSLGEIDVDRNKAVPSLGEDGQNRSSGVMSQCLGIGLGSLACNHINPHLKPKITNKNGGVDYKALCERYDSHSSKETRIGEAKLTIANL